MSKLIALRIFILAGLLSSAFVQAAGEKTSGGEAAAAAKQAGPAIDAPALSADARKLLDQVSRRVKNINTQELKSLLKPQSGTVVIDVRNPEELNLQGGYIRAENFYNISRGQLELAIDTHVPDKRYAHRGLRRFQPAQPVGGGCTDETRLYPG